MVGVGPLRRGKPDRPRRKTPRAAKHLRAIGPEADDRVVHRADDRPIVRQQQVRDRAETLLGVLDRNGHRLIREVSAGANDRPPQGRHQQMVQRRVGQHDAEIRIAGSHRGIRDWGLGIRVGGLGARGVGRTIDRLRLRTDP